MSFSKVFLMPDIHNIVIDFIGISDMLTMHCLNTEFKSYIDVAEYRSIYNMFKKMQKIIIFRNNWSPFNAEINPVIEYSDKFWLNALSHLPTLNIISPEILSIYYSYFIINNNALSYDGTYGVKTWRALLHSNGLVRQLANKKGYLKVNGEDSEYASNLIISVSFNANVEKIIGSNKRKRKIYISVEFEDMSQESVIPSFSVDISTIQKIVVDKYLIKKKWVDYLDVFTSRTKKINRLVGL